MADLVTFLLSKVRLHGGAPAGKACQLCGETKTPHYAYVNDELESAVRGLSLPKLNIREEQALEVVKQAEAEWPKASLKSIALLVAMTLGDSVGHLANSSRRSDKNMVRSLGFYPCCSL